MARLCERPGCSEPGAAAYGMVPEDLVFWISSLSDAPTDLDPNVLCLRHADAMVVPRGWTLDDRREDTLRLFKPRPVEPASPAAPATARRRRRRGSGMEQLQIDGTGEVERPATVDQATTDEATDDATDDAVERGATGRDDGRSADAPWRPPTADVDDDLGGLLEVSSPLLSRAFRGTDRRRS